MIAHAPRSLALSPIGCVEDAVSGGIHAAEFDSWWKALPQGTSIDVQFTDQNNSVIATVLQNANGEPTLRWMSTEDPIVQNVRDFRVGYWSPPTPKRSEDHFSVDFARHLDSIFNYHSVGIREGLTQRWSNRRAKLMNGLFGSHPHGELAGPNAAQFSLNLRTTLAALGVPVAAQILPARMFWSDGQVRWQDFGVPLPPDASALKPGDPVPWSTILKMISERRFPIGDQTSNMKDGVSITKHDIDHLIGFALDPEYAEAWIEAAPHLVNRFIESDSGQLSPLGVRAYIALEHLARVHRTISKSEWETSLGLSQEHYTQGIHVKISELRDALEARPFSEVQAIADRLLERMNHSVEFLGRNEEDQAYSPVFTQDPLAGPRFLSLIVKGNMNSVIQTLRSTRKAKTSGLATAVARAQYMMRVTELISRKEWVRKLLDPQQPEADSILDIIYNQSGLVEDSTTASGFTVRAP